MAQGRGAANAAGKVRSRQGRKRQGAGRSPVTCWRGVEVPAGQATVNQPLVKLGVDLLDPLAAVRTLVLSP